MRKNESELSCFRVDLLFAINDYVRKKQRISVHRIKDIENLIIIIDGYRWNDVAGLSDLVLDYLKTIKTGIIFLSIQLFGTGRSDLKDALSVPIAAYISRVMIKQLQEKIIDLQQKIVEQAQTIRELKEALRLAETGNVFGLSPGGFSSNAASPAIIHYQVLTKKIAEMSEHLLTQEKEIARLRYSSAVETDVGVTLSVFNVA